jgi:large subunit ribosomal protein L7/L12
MQERSVCAACGGASVAVEVTSRDGGLVGVRVPGNADVLPLLAWTCSACGHAALYVPSFARAGVAPAPALQGASAHGSYREAAPRPVDVILVLAGTNRIAVIGALRDALGWDFRAAKDAAERPMVIVATGVAASEGERIRAALASAGAVVEVRG